MPHIIRKERERGVSRAEGGGGSRHGDDDNPGHAQMVFCQHNPHNETTT